MTTELGDFPVSDEVLDAIEHAFGGSLAYDEGEPSDFPFKLVGAEYSLDKLLDFLSGVDESKYVLDGEINGIPAYTYEGGQIYSERCMSRALVKEIRRLRSLMEPNDPRRVPDQR